MRQAVFLPFMIALVGSIGLAAPVRSQIVEGQVTDSISGVHVGGGFIVLVDVTGREQVRVLTAMDGTFYLPAPRPGTYRLRSERIAYRVWESPDFTLTGGQSRTIDPIINSLPRRLASIEVTGETECKERKGPDTGLLWEEAEKALVAASWSSQQQLYVHRVHNYERELDRSRNNVEAEKIDVRVLSTELPFISRHPVELEREGYVFRGQDGNMEWWAPDANVLLDPSFHRTHCFWAVRGEDERTGMIGLAFEPAPDRELPDVEGTLWLDEASSELREIEFRFTDIPLRISTNNLGGFAKFLPMPSGAWILNAWQVRMPIVRWRGFGRRPRIIGYSEVGGHVLEARTLEGEKVYEVPGLVTLRGTVYDSMLGGPIANDAVSVVNTEYASITDSAGRFEMRVLLNGSYQLTTSRLNWLGYLPGRVSREFTPGDTVDAELVIPSLETVHLNLCPKTPFATNLVVHGEVRTPQGNGLENAEVVARWEPGVERKDRTDAAGRYELCDLPNDVAITVDVRHRLMDHDPIAIRFVGRDVIVETAAGPTSYYVPSRVAAIGLEVRGRN
ncbi:MAG: carboxypeptidase-like regulatory domain-containing protein [Gemmatimonadetes bacterium]|nr:carboxypeptidase-like regulatory domain-containing protein [Gemmatimonadota bacterium]